MQAVRQGNLLGCAFHPELTNDPRWHRLFLQMVQTHKAAAVTGAAQ
jgi:5'-phosphate synthase pdxT subunit